jgi:hypothetical protein
MDGFGINLYKSKLAFTFFALHHDVNYGTKNGCKKFDVSPKNCKSTKPSSRVIAHDDTMRETWWNWCSMCVIIKEVMEWQGWQKLSWCGSSVTGFILFACIQWLNKKYHLILNNYFCSLKLLVYSSKLIEQFNMMIQ